MHIFDYHRARRGQKGTGRRTLTNGLSSTPIRNFVILVDGERIEQVAAVGSLEVPPDYQMIATEGISVLPIDNGTAWP